MTTGAIPQPLAAITLPGPTGPPAGEPGSLLDLVDRYLAGLLALDEAAEAGAAPARVAAMAAQLGLPELATSLVDRIGPGRCVTRSGFALALALVDGAQTLAACRIAQDLDEIARLDAEHRYAARILALAADYCRGEGAPDRDDELDVAGAILLATDAELAEALWCLPLLRGRTPPRDMAEFHGLGRELLALAREQRGWAHPDQCFAALEAAMAVRSTGPIGPDKEPSRSPLEDRDPNERIDSND